MESSRAMVIPARVEPPAEPLGAWRYLRALVRNPLEVWPHAVYRDRLYVDSFLGRKTLFVMDPDLIHQILVEDADSYHKSEMMQRLLRPAIGKGILTSEGTQWRRQRRIVAPLFRPGEIAAYVPSMIAAADIAVARLKAMPEGAPVSLGTEMMRTTFDIVADTILTGADRFDVPALADAINTYLSATGWVVAIAQLGLPERFPYPGRRRVMAARDHLRRVTAELVAERRKGGYRRDIVQALIDARDEETGEAMSDVEIVDNLLTFIAAGHETTALSLTWSFYLLSLHPEIEAKVLTEIAAAGGADGTLSPEALAGLGYTRQVISEALRLYPAAPSLLRSPAVPVNLGGHALKPGAGIFIPVYAIHRHQSYWSDPDRFDPERFRPDVAKARPRYVYLPFAGGPRVCIGMGFALLEAVAILARMLPHFRFEPAGEPPMPIAQTTLRPRAMMPVRLRHRR